MLAEIIIYIALFAALFSGTFAAAFQTIDTVRSLQRQKTELDSLFFLQSKLNAHIYSLANWSELSGSSVNSALAGSGLSINFVSSDLMETATSSSRVLTLTLEINAKIYIFSYVQEK